ncbi:hypothetical protein MAJJADAN_00031 [Pseudomonas phage Amjad_SA]|nr:hypothetical protein MAJJADAN_00031 [Pseudomonas phage Amjad_SA]
MARRTQEITIDQENRDKGKTFVITEMASEQAEWWAFRVMQALVAADAGVSFDAPLAKLAKVGIQAIGKLSPEQARPIFDEMMSTVSVKLPSGGTRPLLPDDIEEISTRFRLRLEFGKLHLDFFGIGGE